MLTHSCHSLSKGPLVQLLCTLWTVRKTVHVNVWIITTTEQLEIRICEQNSWKCGFVNRTAGNVDLCGLIAKCISLRIYSCDIHMPVCIHKVVVLSNVNEC